MSTRRLSLRNRSAREPLLSSRRAAVASTTPLFPRSIEVREKKRVFQPARIQFLGRDQTGHKPGTRAEPIYELYNIGFLYFSKVFSGLLSVVLLTFFREGRRQTFQIGSKGGLEGRWRDARSMRIASDMEARGSDGSNLLSTQAKAALVYQSDSQPEPCVM